MTRPDRGSMKLNGKPLAFRSNRDAIAAGVAYVSEDRLTLGLVQPQSIADNIVLPCSARSSTASTSFPPARRRPSSITGSGELAVKIGKPDDAVSTLSGGNQQRIVLAKWLATDPKLLILDPHRRCRCRRARGLFAIVRNLAEQGWRSSSFPTRCRRSTSTPTGSSTWRGGRFVGTHNPGADGARRRSRRRSMRRASQCDTEGRLTVVLVLVCVILSLASDQFLTLANFSNLLSASAVNLIFAVGPRWSCSLPAASTSPSPSPRRSCNTSSVYAPPAVDGGNWAYGFLFAALFRRRARRHQRRPHPLLPHHLDRGDHRHLQHLFRAA